MVPENFEFESCNTKRMWDLWLFGNISAGIAPFRQLTGSDLKPAQRRMLYAAKYVCNYLLAECSSRSLPVDTNMNASASFDVVFMALFKKIHGEDAVWEDFRFGQTTFNRVYDVLLKLKKAS